MRKDKTITLEPTPAVPVTTDPKNSQAPPVKLVQINLTKEECMTIAVELLKVLFNPPPNFAPAITVSAARVVPFVPPAVPPSPAPETK